VSPLLGVDRPGERCRFTGVGHGDQGVQGQEVRGPDVAVGERVGLGANQVERTIGGLGVQADAEQAEQAVLGGSRCPHASVLLMPAGKAETAAASPAAQRLRLPPRRPTSFSHPGSPWKHTRGLIMRYSGLRA